MKKIKFVLLIMGVALLPSALVNAQLITRSDVLRRASTIRSGEEAALHEHLLVLAKQKGWPLVVTHKNGNQSFLVGIDRAGFPLYIGTHDGNNAAATIKTNTLWPGGKSGLNLTGSSPNLKGKIAIWDGGAVRATHVELVGRVKQIDTPKSTSFHATSMAGIMIATGVNPAAKGMAFQTQQLNAYQYVNNAGSLVDVSEMMAASPNLLISNHSYGLDAGWLPDEKTGAWTWYGNFGDTIDYKFGYYDAYAQAWDSIAYNAPNYLIVNSSGNARGYNGPAIGDPYSYYSASGVLIKGKRSDSISNQNSYQTISSPGLAKNILSVGAVNPIPGGYTNPLDGVISYFSSWGPTDDGRIKPDVVTDGVNIFAPVDASNTAYAINSGTSEASAAASGSAILLQEYYSRIHSGSFMRSATLKGLLIHTADEVGPAIGPDYQFGWGLVNMYKAASVITSDTMPVNPDQKIYQNNLLNDSSFTISVTASGKGQLTATICWTDPPAALSPGPAFDPIIKLVNDLDLRITSGGSTYYPWILDSKNPSAFATTGDNIRDNVEKISVPNAVAGQVYTIRVTHKGTLSRGQQAYTLLVSGAGGQSFCTSSAISNAGTRIDSVNFSNLHNASPAGCTQYTNYTAQTAQIQPNQKIPVRIALSSCDGSNNPRIVKIFIDYNSNDLFDQGEQVAVSPILPGGNYVFTDTITTPANLTVGSFSRMRIVVQETTDSSAVHACGTYANGETQDYSIKFIADSIDVGVSSIVSPAGTTCANDNQLVSVTINNYGTSPEANVPVNATVRSGNTVIADLNFIYPDTIPPYSSVVYTFQTPFQAVGGRTYTIQSSTSLPGDEISADDSVSASFTATLGNSIIPTGVAELCGTSKVFLKSTVKDSSNVAFWYDSANALNPIAVGNDTSTTILPANHTYYLGLNQGSLKVGPPNKLVFPAGGYNAFNGNYVAISNATPVTLESARLYIGSAGTITFLVVDSSNYNSSTGSFDIQILSSNTINVYPTRPTRPVFGTNDNNPQDTGAIFLLNLPIAEKGNHLLIVDCENGASIFRNNSISSNPYPYSIPGIFSIYNNSATSKTNPVLYQQYYYFLYDVSIQLPNCPSQRVPILATVSPSPVITLTRNVLSSNIASGNQWYLGDSALAGATGAQDTITFAGVYKSVVSDSNGCVQTSNLITHSLPPNDISMNVFPDPNRGQFTLQFQAAVTTDVYISIVNTLGQRVYTSSYPNFSGIFSKQINAGLLPPGMYVVQVQVADKSHVVKFLIN